jgi:hypothetical protein
MADPTVVKEVSDIINQLSGMAQQLSGSEIGKLTYWVIWWKYLGYEIFRRGSGAIMFAIGAVLLLRKRRLIIDGILKGLDISDEVFFFNVVTAVVFVVCGFIMFA